MMSSLIIGQTPLHLAIYYGYFDIAMLLLNYGASFELIDKKMKSPVQYCCKPKNYVTHEQSQIKEQLVSSYRTLLPNILKRRKKISFLIFCFCFFSLID